MNRRPPQPALFLLLFLLSSAESSFPASLTAVARVHSKGPLFQQAGTAVVIECTNKRTLLLTSAHVLTRINTDLQVSFPTGDTLDARRVEVDRDRDLAMLQCSPVSIAPVQLALHPPTPGEGLTAAGYGREGKLRLRVQTVLGYGQSKPGGPHDTLITQGSSEPGDSGGPLLDRNGRLAGLVWGARNGRTYANAITQIAAFTPSCFPRAPPAIDAAAQDPQILAELRAIRSELTALRGDLRGPPQPPPQQPASAQPPAFPIETTPLLQRIADRLEEPAKVVAPPLITATTGIPLAISTAIVAIFFAFIKRDMNGLRKMDIRSAARAVVEATPTTIDDRLFKLLEKLLPGGPEKPPPTP